MIGLVFADETEAKNMHKNIANRQKYATGMSQPLPLGRARELTWLL